MILSKKQLKILKELNKRLGGRCGGECPADIGEEIYGERKYWTCMNCEEQFGFILGFKQYMEESNHPYCPCLGWKYINTEEVILHLKQLIGEGMNTKRGLR